MDVDLTRTRVVLAELQGEQERLAAGLAASGLTSFTDRADWLFQHRSPDRQLAWRRHWLSLGIRDPEPRPEHFDRPRSLAAPKEKPVPIISEERQLEIAIASLERQEKALPPLAQEVMKFHALKMSDTEIAKRIGCAPETVQRWRKRLSLRANTQGGQNTSRYLPPIRRAG